TTLIDRRDESGKMTEARWKTVQPRLDKSLITRMEEDPIALIPTFDGAGWPNGVKILNSIDDPTRKLEVVDRELILSIPKAKVLVPIAIQGKRALKLRQPQNPDIPTADWKVLHTMSLATQGNAHTLKAGEVEKDLGQETIVDAVQELTLYESEEEEDGDLTLVVNPSSGVE
ncbi:hypothetical protein KR200_010047, partial [Drosophila serrata]